MSEFVNDDKRLVERAEQACQERKQAGIEGLVGGLEAVIVNVAAGELQAAAEEFVRYTGYDFAAAFQETATDNCLLTLDGSADFLFRTRKAGENPFLPYNQGVKTPPESHPRLETFVYRCSDLETYAARQKARGVAFMTDAIVDCGGYLFIQTTPSIYTGNSTGFIQWKEPRGNYASPRAQALDLPVRKPDAPYLKNIRQLDHSATRVKAEHRDDAIIEFIGLTNYDFAFAVYVESLNSITNVARLSPTDYAQVFTSGIKPFTSEESSGPTEMFIHNYGLRVHHLAFHTEEISKTFQALKDDGLGFLLELVGSPEEGLKQTFSKMSPKTLLVNEYIHRYNGFDGFFTKSNVTELTRATEQQ